MNSPAVALFLAGLVSAVLASGCEPSCPEGYVNWEDNCYKVYAVAKTWENAEKHCRDDAAHLASVHSDAENDFLESLTHRADKDPETWIGFNDLKIEGQFEWSDGSPVDYKRWHKGEPSNGGKHGEDCTELNHFTTSGTWNDKPCNYQLQFVCKMPLS